MKTKRRFPIPKILTILGLCILLGAQGAFPQSDPSLRKDAPIGLIVYCPSPSEKDLPFDFERTLALWYKRFKAQRTSEGGGAILLVSAPFLPKNSPEVERLRTSLGAEVIFPGFHSVVEKKQEVPKASVKNKTKSKKKKISPVPKQETLQKTKVSGVKKKKRVGKKVSSKKESKPVIPPGYLVLKEEAGLGFAFYSPSLEALQSKSTNPWTVDFQTQLTKSLETHNLHFLLLQDPKPNSIEGENPILDEVQAVKKNLTETIPSILLLSEQRALRFYNGEYSFGCGAVPNSLKISVLELFYRNGSLIRISEDSQTLNSKESNKSWILE